MEWSPPSPSATPAAAAAAVDPVLLPFLEAGEGEAARSALGALLESRAAPLLRSVIRRQLGGWAPVQEGQDVEDVAAGALLRLAQQLWSLRQGPGSPIESFAGYVAATAQNACHAFLRRRQPERARLRSRLRYLLGHDPQLALWDSGGELLCGLAVWRGRETSTEASRRLRELKGRVAAPSARDRSAQEALAFARLVRDLLGQAGGPCRLGELQAILEDVLGVLAAPPVPPEALDTGPLAVASRQPSPIESLEQREYLGQLWAEVRLLPRHQRVALLLNLRDAEGRDMIGLIPLVGLATQAEIAAALELPLPRLEAIWEELPRDDEWIAGELGVTRRQVINFRKCARERLARRMRQPEGGGRTAPPRDRP
jgi:DNA-directed RNA polymerase specialized sigma24 family protein